MYIFGIIKTLLFFFNSKNIFEILLGNILILSKLFQSKSAVECLKKKKLLILNKLLYIMMR